MQVPYSKFASIDLSELRKSEDDIILTSGEMNQLLHGLNEPAPIDSEHIGSSDSLLTKDEIDEILNIESSIQDTGNHKDADDYPAVKNVAAYLLIDLKTTKNEVEGTAHDCISIDVLTLHDVLRVLILVCRDSIGEIIGGSSNTNLIRQSVFDLCMKCSYDQGIDSNTL